MNETIGVGERLLVRAVTKDRYGRHTDAVEVPQFTLEDLGGNPDAPTAILEADPRYPFTCRVRAMRPGAFVLKFTCDGDLGECLEPLERAVHGQVVERRAVAIDLETEVESDEEAPPDEDDELPEDPGAAAKAEAARLESEKADAERAQAEASTAQAQANQAQDEADAAADAAQAEQVEADRAADAAAELPDPAKEKRSGRRR